MPFLISYQKATTPITTISLNLHAPGSPDAVGQEIATVDGVTYVALPDGATLPATQPTEIAASIVNPVTLTDTLREQIKAASPQARLISNRMVEQIRASYSIDDEMYFARIGVGAATGLYTPSADEMQAMTVFGEFVEGVRQWGRDERAKLGL